MFEGEVRGGALNRRGEGKKHQSIFGFQLVHTSFWLNKQNWFNTTIILNMPNIDPPRYLLFVNDQLYVCLSSAKYDQRWCINSMRQDDLSPSDTLSCVILTWEAWQCATEDHRGEILLATKPQTPQRQGWYAPLHSEHDSRLSRIWRISNGDCR